MGKARKLRRKVCTDTCGAVVGGERAWLRRERPDGSTYSLPITVGGARCGRTAAVSRSKGGTTIHRCTAHLRA